MVDDFRLPPSVRPVNYDILLDVDLGKFKFLGRETIEIEITKPTKEIKLNSRDLKVGHVSLTDGKKSMLPRVMVNNEKELVTLSFKENLKGKFNLAMEFEGTLTDSLLGFYRSKYFEKGKEKYLATTQFEAPYARRAFPCFDEPEFKATFDVTLQTDKKLQAISNMPIKHQSAKGNKKIVKFQRTPRMSPYLLYFGVGDFEFLSGKSGKTLVRIVTTRGKREQTKFALDLTIKFLSYFEKYSNIAYPLPKLDMIGLADFAAGAMENWGAITFREVYLLFDPKLTSTTIKKRMAMIIAHELWHQWSGDLVTMKWWNDLWLNESFATFMAYKAVDHYFPEWKIWEDFVSDETSRAFDDDSLKTTHPIEVNVQDPHQIEEIFDAISYSKGGSVLRMLESYLGNEMFRKGVGNYLSENKYGNATSEDLWGSLGKVSHKPIKQMMISWIRQTGYPLVEAKLNGQMLELKQNKFIFNQTNSTTKWMIPLVIRFDNNETLAEIFDKKENKIKLNSQPQWLKINYNQTGFYRVNYLDENLSRISYTDLSSIDRWGIQNDVFKLTLNTELPLERYLDFLKLYRNEADYLVLGDIYSNLRFTHFIFSHEDFWPKIWTQFKKHFKLPFKIAFERLRWEPHEDESQSDSLLRNLAIRYLSFAEDQEIINQGMEKYQQYLKGEQLHPDIKYPVLAIATGNGNEKTFDELVKLYSTTPSPEEKITFLQALAQFKDPDILSSVLDFSLSKKVRVQDMQIILRSVAANPAAKTIFFPWIRKNWKKLESYKNSGSVFVRLLEIIISYQFGKEMEKELQTFFKSHPVKYKNTIERSFEKLRRNTSWMGRNRKTLAEYFS